MMPVVCSFSPTSAFLSSTVTRMPACAKAVAHASPAKLAPTMVQSVSVTVQLLCRCVAIRLNERLAPMICTLHANYEVWRFGHRWRRKLAECGYRSLFVTIGCNANHINASSELRPKTRKDQKADAVSRQLHWVVKPGLGKRITSLRA